MGSLLERLKAASDGESSPGGPPSQPTAPALPAAPTPQPPPAPPPAPAVTFRDFGDASATRAAIYDNVLAAARKIKPVSNARYGLALEGVDYEDPEDFPLARQKAALLRGESLYRRLRGDWVLRDAGGAELERKRATIAQVPHLTERGTFVLNGTENSLYHQMRLRPGVYTRVKANGELETMANIMPGKGMTHRYSLEPASGVFKMQFAQANLPLISVLRAYGATDAELRSAWGDELLAANLKKDDPRAIAKLYQRLVRKGKEDDPAADKAKAVAEALAKMEFDPEVNKRTLGASHRVVDKDTILAITRRLLAVNRGEADTDDRDHLAYQYFMGPEDLLAERLARPGAVLNKLLWKASTKGTLKSMPVNAFNRHLHAAILDSGLGRNLEEINPLELLDQQAAVSRLGVGGIASADAVPDESRMVHPSQLGYLDPVRTPESFAAGVDSRLAYTARKGSDGRVYSPYVDPKTGQTIYKSPQDVADLVLAFPGQMDSNEPVVEAVVNSRIRNVPRDKVDLVLPHAEQWFSPAINLLHSKNASKGQRGAMGARFLTQALPLVGAEAPLVRNAVPGTNGKSFEEHYGRHLGAVHAKAAGRVASVDAAGIEVRYEDGTSERHQLYDEFPYNRKTRIHSTPMVQPGDPVQPGQLLAKSNFTNDKGHLALGMNLRTAYTSFRGLNYEDAWVVSESAAKKLASEHLYQHNLDFDDNLKKGRNAYLGIFPGRFDKKALANIGVDGFIKPGAVVRHGDPLVLAAAERPATHKTVHAAHKGSFLDRSLVWDHAHEGVVTDVASTPKGVLVAVKSVQPLVIGDKIAGRYGDKGVVAKVVPDDEMPQDPKSGLAYELLANPQGLISRGNSSQMVEAWLGKVAAKTGKPYVLDDFDTKKDLVAYARQELERHGLEGDEEILDPSTGARPRVATGMRYYLKLHHTSETKSQGRGLGAYTSEESPARTGGPEGSAKRLAMMDVYALMSHGALDVLRDAKLIRGQKNQEYWAAKMGGFQPPTPEAPLVYRKALDTLRAAGVHVERKGNQTHLMALTDKHVATMAENRELKNAETVDWKDFLKEKPGGLFDKALTGGHGGKKWSYYKLHEPLPSPVFEEPIRHLLGLTGKQYEAVLFGREKIGNETGPAAIHAALKQIRVPEAINAARAVIKDGRKGARDEAVRKLRYLKALERQKARPEDWVLSRVPVLPPVFRPVSQMQTGQQLVADMNYLYKEIFDANRNLADLSGKVDDVAEERETLYKAFKAVTGLGDPVQPKNQERRVRGLLASIFGDSPKFGCYDDQTEILSDRGWLPFADLRGGDRVATLNQATGAFEWQAPTAHHVWDYDGQLLRFGTAGGLDCLVTPTHRNWVRYRVGSESCDEIESGWSFEEAQQTAARGNRKWFRTAASGWVGHSRRPAFLSASCSLEDFAAFVGWWTAEGWLGDRKLDRVQIAQGVKHEKECADLERLVASLGLPYGVGEYERTTNKGHIVFKQWSIHSAALAAWLTENVGRGSENKHLSAEVRDWDTPYLTAFFLAYLAGDGGRRYYPRRNGGGVTHKHTSSLLNEFSNASTASTRLADAVQEVACKLGVTARLRRYHVEPYLPAHRINLSGSRFVVLEGAKSSQAVPYTGKVYCVTVPNGVVYVRRGGKPFFSGNSFQRKLLGTTLDLVGRATAVPDPDLSMDEAGIPEGKAWEVYAPFLVRRLVRQGVGRVQALDHVENRHPLARKALLAEMDERPVMINRAPVLHKYGRMAFFPRLVRGHVLRVSPLVVSGFNLDFDGDAMNYEVIADDAAAKEALQKMLPSRNLIATADFKRPMHQPRQEYLAGLFTATSATARDKRPRTFATQRDFLRAFWAGELDSSDPVEVLDEK